MINPIQACGGCGRCDACIAQLPPVVPAGTTGGGPVTPGGAGAMPPPMGAPHEQFDAAPGMPPKMGAPHELADGAHPAPPAPGTADGVGLPATMPDVWAPVQDLAVGETTAAPIVPARVEIPIVPIPMPDTTLPPLGLEDQY